MHNKTIEPMMHSNDFREPSRAALGSSGGEAFETLERGTAQESAPNPLPKIVSLFSGAGGLDLGFKQAGFTVSVAFDSSEAAIRTHRRNFPRAKAVVADLLELQPEGVVTQVKDKIPLGGRIAVIGGPPCQGFSRANVGSQSTDPRNQLPTLYLKIVEALQRLYTVEFIVFENVLGIRDKKHAETYKALLTRIEALGFDVTEKELCALDFGVPQNRRRIVLSGMRKGQEYLPVKPRKRKGLKTVRQAIGGLKAPAYFKRGMKPEDIPVHPNHWTMQPKSPRFDDPEGEAKVDVNGRRSFKRLLWHEPSRTIAFGHREIHIHPSGRRRLSIYEALRLQGFPESFVLEGNLSQQVEQVSNAVPPPLGRAVALAVKCALGGRASGPGR